MRGWICAGGHSARAYRVHTHAITQAQRLGQPSRTCSWPLTRRCWRPGRSFWPCPSGPARCSQRRPGRNCAPGHRRPCRWPSSPRSCWCPRAVKKISNLFLICWSFGITKKRISFFLVASNAKVFIQRQLAAAEAWIILLVRTVEVNGLLQGALRWFTQWPRIEHPTFVLGGGHTITELWQSFCHSVVRFSWTLAQ